MKIRYTVKKYRVKHPDAPFAVGDLVYLIKSGSSTRQQDMLHIVDQYTNGNLRLGGHRSAGWVPNYDVRHATEEELKQYYS